MRFIVRPEDLELSSQTVLNIPANLLDVYFAWTLSKHPTSLTPSDYEELVKDQFSEWPWGAWEDHVHSLDTVLKSLVAFIYQRPSLTNTYYSSISIDRFGNLLVGVMNRTFELRRIADNGKVEYLH